MKTFEEMTAEAREQARSEAARDAAALNAQARAYQRAQVEQARLDASMSPALQRECGIGPLGGVRYGSAQGGGIATTVYRDHQKMFTRAEVLAILRAINATDGRFYEAITAFERME